MYKAEGPSVLVCIVFIADGIIKLPEYLRSTFHISASCGSCSVTVSISYSKIKSEHAFCLFPKYINK
jgi:hypothetical protein